MKGENEIVPMHPYAGLSGGPPLAPCAEGRYGLPLKDQPMVQECRAEEFAVTPVLTT